MDRLVRCLFLFTLLSNVPVEAQKNFVQDYAPVKRDSIRIGKGDTDFLPYIQQGYTLALPENRGISGTIIFLEDSGFDQKNKSARQIYQLVNGNGFAVLSVSTEIPLDFFFSDHSILSVHQTIEGAFSKHKIPNKNIFFIGVGLGGHRALKYIEWMKTKKQKLELSIVGLVICDAPLDWVRQFNEGKRDVRINYDEGAVWEGTFATYMLESHLGSTPVTGLENYLDFSTYSYSDEQSRHIKYFKDYAVRTYLEVAIQYWLEKKRKTPMDNNGPDMVGLIAQLQLAGNEKSELKIIYPNESKTEKKNPDATWESVDKRELMEWILKHTD